MSVTGNKEKPIVIIAADNLKTPKGFDSHSYAFCIITNTRIISNCTFQYGEGAGANITDWFIAYVKINTNSYILKFVSAINWEAIICLKVSGNSLPGVKFKLIRLGLKLQVENLLFHDTGYVFNRFTQTV